VLVAAWKARRQHGWDEEGVWLREGVPAA